MNTLFVTHISVVFSRLGETQDTDGIVLRTQLFIYL